MLHNLQRRDEQQVKASLIPFDRWHKAKEWLAEVNTPRDRMQLSWELSAHFLNHTFSPHSEPSWQNKGIYASKSNPVLAGRWTIESLEVLWYHSSGRKITFPPWNCSIFLSQFLLNSYFPVKGFGVFFSFNRIEKWWKTNRWGKLFLHGIQPEFLSQEDGKDPTSFSAGPLIIEKMSSFSTGPYKKISYNGNKKSGLSALAIEIFLALSACFSCQWSNYPTFCNNTCPWLPHKIVHCIVRAAGVFFFLPSFFPLSSVLIFRRIAVFKTSNNICEMTQCI